jgi:hypothetical protein
MATVQITVPDALVTRLTAAVRAKFPQYNALTAANAFKAVTADYWKAVLSNYEAQVAQDAGQAATASATAAALATAATDATGIG